MVKITYSGIRNTLIGVLFLGTIGLANSQELTTQLERRLTPMSDDELEQVNPGRENYYMTKLKEDVLRFEEYSILLEQATKLNRTYEDSAFHVHRGTPEQLQKLLGNGDPNTKINIALYRGRFHIIEPFPAAFPQIPIYILENYDRTPKTTIQQNIFFQFK